MRGSNEQQLLDFLNYALWGAAAKQDALEIEIGLIKRHRTDDRVLIKALYQEREEARKIAVQLTMYVTHALAAYNAEPYGVGGEIDAIRTALYDYEVTLPGWMRRLDRDN